MGNITYEKATKAGPGAEYGSVHTGVHWRALWTPQFGAHREPVLIATARTKIDCAHQAGRVMAIVHIMRRAGEASFNHALSPESAVARKVVAAIKRNTSGLL